MGNTDSCLCCANSTNRGNLFSSLKILTFFFEDLKNNREPLHRKNVMNGRELQKIRTEKKKVTKEIYALMSNERR